MSQDPRVANLLEDIRLQDARMYALVAVLRALVIEVAPGAGEEVKYGGLFYTGQTPFCGIYAYQQHVTLEFSHGCALQDTAGVLEGKGKLRRHIRIEHADDIVRKAVRQYVAQAYAQAV